MSAPTDFIPIADADIGVQIIRRVYNSGFAGSGVYGEVTYQTVLGSQVWIDIDAP